MRENNRKKRNSFPDGSKLKIGVVVSGFHEDITGRMLDGARAALATCKVKKENIRIMRVPGSFEIPYGCLMLLEGKKYDALVALGCIIKGETNHDYYIASAVSQGIMDIMLRHRVPIGFGVITANNLKQANARSTGKTNKGSEAALAAVEMALL